GFKKEVATIAANRGFKTYRLDNIFRTNVQSSYMAGRWSQIQKAKKYRPYAMYSAVRDKLTRAIHYALHGKVYPVDHPFWDTWFPPNGFKCRCNLKTLSERQVKARGLKVESKDITGNMVQPVDKDGITLLPVNLLPDPGFSRNSAKDYFAGIVEKAVNDSKGLKEIKNKSKKLKSLKLVKSKSYKSTKEVESDVLNEPVINPKKTELSESKSDLSIIKNPSEVWLVPHKTEKGRVKLVKRYIAKMKKKNVIAEVVGGVLIKIKELSSDSLEAKRGGFLLWANG
ncbi:MAG: hypothetical protein GY760_21180, partial [Deltaproteobacteria bacterium]|nr:hypothetical protein [Deltaproteobacteria bacterium]